MSINGNEEFAFKIQMNAAVGEFSQPILLFFDVNGALVQKEFQVDGILNSPEASD